ncbi:hypothetical protein V6N13_124094 [Hibiscus sabdariffa]
MVMGALSWKTSSVCLCITIFPRDVLLPLKGCCVLNRDATLCLRERRRPLSRSHSAVMFTRVVSVVRNPQATILVE